MAGMLEQAEGERPADNIAPGSGADGKVVMLTPDEAAAAIGQRNADEEAFAPLASDDMDLDLDAMSVEELDSLIEGLDAGADAA